MVDQIEFREESEEESNEQTSLSQIVLRHIKKISDLCVQEFTKGYWQKRPIKTSGGVAFTEEYHQDTRECYCNAVDFLSDIVYSKADKPFKELVDEQDKKIYSDVLDKLKDRKKLFREMNIMFDRVGFFDNSDAIDE